MVLFGGFRFGLMVGDRLWISGKEAGICLLVGGFKGLHKRTSFMDI